MSNRAIFLPLAWVAFFVGCTDILNLRDETKGLAGSTTSSSRGGTTSSSGSSGTGSTSGTGGTGGAASCAAGLGGGSQVWSSEYGSVPDPGPVGPPVSVAVDAQGNVIVAGTFDGSTDLGCGPLTGTSMGSNLFVAKLDPSGACLWSKGFGATSNVDGGYVGAWLGGVAVDATNNVILMGPFSGSIVFGSNQLASGGLFVTKLDTGGTPLWSMSLDVDATGYPGQSVAVDASGNVLVLGSLYGSVDIAGHVLTSPPAGSIFVAKLDSGGVPVWGKSFLGLFNAAPGGLSIAVDPSGNSLVIGDVDESADFGCGAPLFGVSDFVVKLDPNGACVWNKGFTAGSGWAFLQSVATGASGQVVVTGRFGGPGAADFGSGPVAGMATDNLFVVSLDANGVPAWGKAFGLCGATVSGEGIAVDAAGNVLVTGTVVGSVDFGSGVLTSTGAGGDAFLASFDGDGTLRWARLFGAPAVLGNLAIAVGPTCHMVVAGDFEGTLDFGGAPLASETTRVFVADLAR
jgi:hypothetical protein